MKIGILTFHCAKNYGAVLQCFALYTFLKNKGYEVGVVDYKPYYLAGVDEDSSFYKRFITYLKSIFYRILNFGETEIGDIYKHFRNRHIELIDVKDIKKLDLLICGSDQIWNPNITKGFDPMYFGLHAITPHTKVISYAASMGLPALSDSEIDVFLSMIVNYDSISVREQSLSDFLNTHKIENRVVVDPVILAGIESFKSIIIPIRQKKKYVLVYELTRMPYTYTLARNLASQIDAEVIVIGGGLKRCFSRGILNKQWLSPSQFVSYLSAAVCVVTNSFHGLAFSLLFNKPLYILKTQTWKDDRLLSLLSQVDLSDRVIDHDIDVEFTTIDYTLPNKKINELQSLSSVFLIKNIESVI